MKNYESFLEKNRKLTRNNINKLILKQGETRKVVVLSDELTVREIHQFQDGDRFKIARCFKESGLEYCMLCGFLPRDNGQQPKAVALIPICDLTKVADKNGNIWERQRRYIIAKKYLVDKFKRKSDKRKAEGHQEGLKGCVLELSRSSKNQIIDDMEILGEITSEELNSAEFQPINFDEVAELNYLNENDAIQLISKYANPDEIKDTLKQYGIIDKTIPF